jgi:phosphatidylglycerophosphate synthase
VAHDLDRPREFVGHEGSILEQTAAARDSGGILRAQSANALSALRFVLAAAWVALALAGAAERAEFAGLALAGAASDFIDGRLARRLGVSGGFGRWLDSVADVTFVLAALFCEAARGAIPYYVPALIACSFAQYAIDSLALDASRGPIRSRLGHWGGIVNYALVLALAFAPPGGPAAAAIRAFAPALAIFYLAAIAERALGYRRR